MIDQSALLGVSEGLSAEIIQGFGIPAKALTFSKGDVLFRPGDLCEMFLLVSEGSIRVELTSRSGRDVVLYRIKPGETCVLTTSALLNGEEYYAFGVTESDVRAFAITAPEFQHALTSKSMFACYILSDYAARISAIIKLVDRMAARDVMYDVCVYLSSSVNTANTITATQDQIAKEIGSVREVVSRKLSDLEAENVISRRRGEIHVLKPDKLARLIGD